MPATIEELKELLAKATPGKWFACQSGILTSPTTTRRTGRIVMRAMTKKDGKVIAALHSEDAPWGIGDADVPKTKSRANTRLIVAAINALPSLIEEAGLARKFAEEIEDSWRVFDEGARCHFCGQELRSAGPLCDSVCDHDPDCIVPVALAFLSRDKESAK